MLTALLVVAFLAVPQSALADERPFQINGTPVRGTEEPATAPQLTPGQYVDSYDAGGTTRHYQIPRSPGSTVTASITSNPYHGQNIDTPAPKSAWHLGAADAIGPRLMIFTPSRVLLTRQNGAVQRSNTAKLTAVSPEARIRNREISADSEVRAASVAGDYYVAVLLDPVTDVKGRVMKIRLRLAVEGQPQGQPVYASTAPSPSVSNSGSQASTTEPPTSDDATSTGISAALPLILLGGLVAALGVAAGLIIGFRRGKRSA